MNWEPVLGYVNPYLPVATLLLIGQCVWLSFALAAHKRASEKALEKAESRLHDFTRIRLAELDSRLEASGQSQRTNWEEIRRDLAERELRWSLGTPRTVGQESASRLDKKHQVVSLAQMGLDSRDISRKLRLPLGETELLLGLWENFAPSGMGNGNNNLH